MVFFLIFLQRSGQRMGAGMPPPYGGVRSGPGMESSRKRHSQADAHAQKKSQR